jgi:superfamily II DNA or RNA helicase
VVFEDRVVPRNEEQERAWRSLAINENGILNLGCGKGKTVLAVKKIAQKSVPTLVIVPDGGILEQWKNTILGDPSRGTPPRISFEGELGIIQGPVFNWAKPITLALVTTLWRRIEDGAIPEEMFRYFGLIVYDEVHQIGAPKFSLTASPFYGDRLGLTATVLREDGLDPIYRYHIGEPFYTDVVQDLIPEIYFQKTPVRLPWEESKINDTVNISVLSSMLGVDFEGCAYRYWCIKNALNNGRKILALSRSKKQLLLLHAMFPGSGLIVQETKKDQRLSILRNSQLCFATSKLGAQGVDDDALDALFCLTPFKSKITLQQAMGRIQRPKEGKKKPYMVIFEDWGVLPLRKMCQAMKSLLREWGFTFEIQPPIKMPDIPAEVKEAYDRAIKQLPGDDDSDDEAE